MSVASVILTPSTSELPPGWSAQDLRLTAQRAADRWSFPNVPCSVKVTVAEGRPAWMAARDGVNVIAYRAQTWCHNGRCGASSTFPLRATAMTTTYPGNAQGGAPAEADIELNGVAFRFTGGQDDGSNAAPTHWSVPLESVLAHEIGHVLGLADACGSDRRASGQPISARCNTTERARVMYAANVGTTPTPADVDELCSIYPQEHASAAADMVSHGASRALSAAGFAAEPLFVTFVFGLLALRRRIRRPARRARRERTAS